MSYKTKVTVRFRHTDLVGITYFNEVFNLFHDVYEEFIDKCILPKKEWFNNESWGVPFKKVEAEYLRPLMPFEDYDVEVEVKSVGQKSFSLETLFLKDGALCAKTQTVHVFASYSTQKSLEIPEDIQKKLSKLVVT